MKPSDSSAMRALRVCIESTTSIRVSAVIDGAAGHFLAHQGFGMMPMTVPPAARQASATAPIRPMLPAP
jgi:hypothetical protein